MTRQKAWGREDGARHQHCDLSKGQFYTGSHDDAQRESIVQQGLRGAVGEAESTERYKDYPKSGYGQGAEGVARRAKSVRGLR